MAHTMRALIAAQQRPDSAKAVAQRIRRIAAGRWAHEETLAKFGAFTPENVREALEFQAKRMAELEAEGGE